MATSYSFVVEDITAPVLESVLWLNPRKCRIRWSEPVETGAEPGGSCFVIPLAGIEVVNASQIRVRGIVPQASWIGYYCQVANSHPINNRVRRIVDVSAAAGTITLDTAAPAGPMIGNLTIASSSVYDDGVDKNDSGVTVRRRVIKASISGYFLEDRLVEEGSTLLPNDPERIQCCYLPLPVSASVPTAEELPSGEDPAAYTYLLWHDDVSFERLYTLSAVGVNDPYGNISTTANALDFEAPAFGRPANRIGFWTNGILAPTDKTSDLENGGILRRVTVVLQDLLNSLWYRVDQIQYLNDPGLCPDGWVDHLLYNEGNPFLFPLPTTLFKRRLVAYLRSLYRKVGVSGGIIEFIYRVLGITIDIQPYILEPSWLIGNATYGILGVSTKLGAGTAYEKNCYKVLIVGLDRPLTEAERRIIRDVCEWADPIWMHLVLIDDGYADSGGVPAALGQWVLGVSGLGTQSYLS